LSTEKSVCGVPDVHENMKKSTKGTKDTKPKRREARGRAELKEGRSGGRGFIWR